jgi:hypothetical protein
MGGSEIHTGYLLFCAWDRNCARTEAPGTASSQGDTHPEPHRWAFIFPESRLWEAHLADPGAGCLAVPTRPALPLLLQSCRSGQRLDCSSCRLPGCPQCCHLSSGKGLPGKAEARVATPLCLVVYSKASLIVLCGCFSL